MTKEQVENLQDARPEIGEDQDKSSRSSIQFPCDDLNDAIATANAVHDNAGVECTLAQARSVAAAIDPRRSHQVVLPAHLVNATTTK